MPHQTLSTALVNFTRVKGALSTVEITRNLTMSAIELVKPHLERLLEARAHPKTICPSEAARALTSSEVAQAGANTWRDLMPMIRRYAFEIRDRGEAEILQKGQVVPFSKQMTDVRGPIRLRKKQ